MSAAQTAAHLKEPHDRVTLRGAAGEVLWCLKSACYHALAPFRRLPLCRVGVHEWCACCSPVTCIRCGEHGHD